MLDRRLVEVAEPGEAIQVPRETLERQGVATLEPWPGYAGQAGPWLAARWRREWLGLPPGPALSGRTGDKVVEITKVVRLQYFPTTSALPAAQRAAAHRVDYMAQTRIQDDGLRSKTRDRELGASAPPTPRPPAN